MQSTLSFSPSGAMDSLPTELKCLIAFHLRNCDANPHGPRDIKQFRLLNKAFSIAGAKYLLPEIYLTFQSQSFERLRTVSEHPFFSQYVKQIRYEPDAYGDKDVRINDRKNGHHTRCDHCQKKYRSYKAVCLDQESIRSQHDSYNFDLVAQSMARLPKLAGVTLNFEHRSNAFNRAYVKTLLLPRGDYGHKNPYGTMQLRSVLFGAASAETKLKSLDCGMIDWKVLKANEDQMEKMKTAVKHLEYFRIMLYTGRGYLRYDDSTLESFPCYMFLKSNVGMCELLSAMKDLKVLNLSIDELSSADLKYMLGTTLWASLRVVELGSIMVAEDYLIDFLKRHAGTLKELELNDIVLVAGEWTSTLPRIRSAVELEKFRAVGYWRALTRPSQKWGINTSQNSPDCDDPVLSRRFKLGVAVRKYVLEGGNCPLLDSATYPPI